MIFPALYKSSTLCFSSRPSLLFCSVLSGHSKWLFQVGFAFAEMRMEESDADSGLRDIAFASQRTQKRNRTRLRPAAAARRHHCAAAATAAPSSSMESVPRNHHHHHAPRPRPRSYARRLDERTTCRGAKPSKGWRRRCGGRSVGRAWCPAPRPRPAADAAAAKPTLGDQDRQSC